jgi:hypothetical protein
MPNTENFYIIQGMTNAGRDFGPNDWAERLCGVLGSFDAQERLHYSEDVLPIVIEGVRCVAFCPALARKNPRGFRFLMDFARENDLRLVRPQDAKRVQRERERVPQAA